MLSDSDASSCPKMPFLASSIAGLVHLNCRCLFWKTLENTKQLLLLSFALNKTAQHVALAGIHTFIQKWPSDSSLRYDTRYRRGHLQYPQAQITTFVLTISRDEVCTISIRPPKALLLHRSTIEGDDAQRQIITLNLAEIIRHHCIVERNCVEAKFCTLSNP